MNKNDGAFEHVAVNETTNMNVYVDTEQVIHYKLLHTSLREGM